MNKNRDLPKEVSFYSKLGKAAYIYPYLLRDLQVIRPNQVWEIDITYIRMQKGLMCLTAIIDVYSRFVYAFIILSLFFIQHGHNVQVFVQV